MQLSFLNEHSAHCDSQIGRCLGLSSRIIVCLSTCCDNLEVYASQPIVNLQQQKYALFLFPAERNSLHFNLDLKENNDIVKQRSDKWYALRKEAKVTECSLYNVLGLSSLSDLKQHHYQFIKKRAPLPFPEDVKKHLKYGMENEKHVIATVLGNLMPALLPSCFTYQEMGPVFLPVRNEEKFLEVSTEGLLMCFGGENCSERKSTEYHNTIPLEAKCVYPNTSKPIEPMYSIYPCYIPQT